MKNLLKLIPAVIIGLTLVLFIAYTTNRLVKDPFWNIPTRSEVQQMLAERNYDIGEEEGVIGPKTNRAWQLYEFDKRASRSMNSEGIPK